MAAHAETAPYVDAFRARAGEPPWLAARRAASLDHFAALGFPTRREEAWRFTDLRPLERAIFPPVAAPLRGAAGDIARWRLPGVTHRIVLVDGGFAPDLSAIGTLPHGVYLAPTARALVERPALVEAALADGGETGRQPFAALNAAYFTDGFVLALEPGAVLEAPVEVIHLGSAGAARSHHLRCVVQLGAGSRAQLVETCAGDGPYWTNMVTAIHLHEDAALVHVRIEDEGQQALHFSLLRASLDRAAHYDAFALTLGARLSRQDIQVRFDGPGAACDLAGAFLLRGEQEATTAIVVDHAVPQCTTRELFKGVVDDRAHGVFLGRIVVRPDAQKSDAQQVNRNLLLSRRAAVDTKPELEILADDVKCSHGATVGDLEEESLFYLRTRGIPEGEARQLLVEAFAAETLDRLAPGPVRVHVASHLTRWLGAGSAP